MIFFQYIDMGGKWKYILCKLKKNFIFLFCLTWSVLLLYELKRWYCRTKILQIKYLDFPENALLMNKMSRII